MTESQWVQSAPGTEKRKRAGLACISCHSKKVRRHQTSLYGGFHVLKSPRPSKREKGRLPPDTEQSPVSAIPADPCGDDRVKIASSHSSVAQTDASIGSGDVYMHVGQDVSPHSLAQPSFLDFDSGLLPPPERITFNTTQATQVPERPKSKRAQLGSSPLVVDAWSSGWAPSSHEQSHKIQEEVVLRPDYGPAKSSTSTITHDAVESAAGSEKNDPSSPIGLQPDLRQSFTETYFEYCYTWCPILDRATLSRELAESPLLDNAIATLGSHVRPPLIPHAGPATYYDRARRLFYDEEEEDLVATLKAVSLFYWWAPRPPSVTHRHSSWWWTSVVIKLAQQAGFYRESIANVSRHGTEPYILRRIWWTAFARERLTAICQGKPCLIDPEDCNIPPPSVQDFPDLEDKNKAEVFVYWVRLCTIIGHIAKRLSRSANSSSTTKSFPADLGQDLIDWVRSLPPHLQLRIGSRHTLNFNRDVHQLHLPYLAVIIVLHLTRSSQSLPQALPPATLAGSCISRILKDVLVRSEIRSLQPITCWYVGMGFMALLQASRSESLKDGASADLEILALSIKELKNMWATAGLFEQTFERLRSNDKSLDSEDFPNRHLGNEQSARALNSEDEVFESGIDWVDYFPFVSSQTSVVAGKLLVQQKEEAGFIFWDGLGDMASDTIPNYQDFMEGLESWADPNSFL
ncbi:hypothetical protein N7517_000903 [Penicillium concentricum]|uniref:Xylanolytic transcriptional activator regulatory domain-containing protein n=1 Tax=Penicillium concentricum TaxID=293559 RepID=A0A9W9VIC5_9EURO|nr:uncharacterized protein N7517_000903 [Penicillium concentricum]KAJ5382992.1 hypothetical protein N7517_000903 [Penicillium concentricum]